MSKLRKLAGFGLSRQNANTEREQSQLLIWLGACCQMPKVQGQL